MTSLGTRLGVTSYVTLGGSPHKFTQSENETKIWSFAMALEEEGTVRLQSSDGDTYEVSLRVAKVSRTLATMLEGQEEPQRLTCISYK